MKILLVIDMLNDFIRKDGALNCGQNGEEIIPFVKNKIDKFRKNNNPVIYIADRHKEDDKEFEMFPKHSVKGTRGAQIIEELEVEDDEVVEKTRYSSFYNTNLEDILLAYGSDKSYQDLEVHVVGVCTNICVIYTVEELRNRDIKTIVYKKGTASFDTEAHKFALNQMESVLGAQIV